MRRKHETAVNAFSAKETPPRMRRKPSYAVGAGAKFGNTSAYAEKTPTGAKEAVPKEKHLRVCGENVKLTVCLSIVLETPPRMRRKHYYFAVVIYMMRNTSAYAEKTVSRKVKHLRIKKHLRVCGENLFNTIFIIMAKETPPRMRRKLQDMIVLRLALRNTSAYAEKT